MEEQTTVINKPVSQHHTGDSQFFNISIRAWLALIVIGTVCAVTLIACISDVISGKPVTIDGQFWMLVGAIIAHYYKEGKPSTTSTK